MPNKECCLYIEYLARPWLNFINFLRTNFLYECCFGSFFLLRFVFGEKFVQKICTFNVDEIDNCTPIIYSSFIRAKFGHLSSVTNTFDPTANKRCVPLPFDGAHKWVILKWDHTLCAKDCGPHNRVCQYRHTHAFLCQLICS